MGRIGSTEMYLIWEVFGIMVMSSGLIIITGSDETPKSGPVFIVKVVDSVVNKANLFFKVFVKQMLFVDKVKSKELH